CDLRRVAPPPRPPPRGGGGGRQPAFLILWGWSLSPRGGGGGGGAAVFFSCRGRPRGPGGGVLGHLFPLETQDPLGQPVPLSNYRGQVLLIVNTASECGFTPQYAGLQSLQEQYAGRGFDVLGFPCNQFGKQEPGDAAQIGEFCEARFHVTFPMFAKIDVN